MGGRIAEATCYRRPCEEGSARSNFRATRVRGACPGAWQKQRGQSRRARRAPAAEPNAQYETPIAIIMSAVAGVYGIDRVTTTIAGALKKSAGVEDDKAE